MKKSNILFQQARLSVHPCVRPCVRSPKFFLAKSTNVTNRCCHICFSDDKNVFGIIPWPPGGSRGAQKGPGGHTKSQSNEKMLLINFVAYASVMTKMHLGWPPSPLGGHPQVAPGHAAPPEELAKARRAFSSITYSDFPLGIISLYENAISNISLVGQIS